MTAVRSLAKRLLTDILADDFTEDGNLRETRSDVIVQIRSDSRPHLAPTPAAD